MPDADILAPAWQLDGTEPPQPDPAQQAARERVAEKHYVKGYVIIGRAPGDNGYTGFIEHSFSMGTSKDRVRLWRKRADKWEGLGAAEYNCREANKSRADWPMPFTVFDVDDPACPIVLDWAWYEGHYERPGTTYGVDKYEVRNLKFEVRP